MKIRTGFSIALETLGPTPITFLVNVRPERQKDLLTPESVAFDPPVEAQRVEDGFGNLSTRVVAPGGRFTVSADFVIADSGLPDTVEPQARQIPVQDLPSEILPFLLGSRYCDTDKLCGLAWSLFSEIPDGRQRIQAIVDYAHERIRFDYQLADPTGTAHDGHTQQVGVCRDFAHLEIAL